MTAVALGETTTRERDFADVLLLTSLHAIDAAELARAINATATHRQTPLRPLRDLLAFLGSRRQPDWQRYLTCAGLQDRLPGNYSVAIENVAAFADPILTSERPTGQWDTRARRWR